MAKLTPVRGAQYTMCATAAINFAKDTAVDVNGLERDLSGAAVTGSFELFALPPGAVLVSAQVAVVEDVVGPTALSLTLGDAANPTRYTGGGAVDVAVAAVGTVAGSNTTGHVTDGKPLLLGVTGTGAATTAGSVTVMITYVINGRVNEVAHG